MGHAAKAFRKALNRTKPQTAALARRFRSDESGAFTIMTGLGATFMIVAAGVAIDINRAESHRATLQAVADSASLAAARALTDDVAELRDIATGVFEQHLGDGAGTFITDIVRDGDAVRVNATEAVPMSLMRLVGTDVREVSVVSQSLYSERELDLSLVLDTTGSMCPTIFPPVVTPTGLARDCSKLDALKAATTEMLDTLDELGSDTVRVAITPFAQHVNAQDIARDVSIGAEPVGWQGCIGTRPAPQDVRRALGGSQVPAIPGGECASSMQPLTGDFQQVRATINDLDARGWTYIPAGLAWGWRQVMGETLPVGQDRRADADKIVVLMTDGANTRSRVPGQVGHFGGSQADADRQTERLCDAAKGDGVVIYTIAFQINDAATQELMRDCATEPGFFFDARDNGDLRAAFQDIAASVVELRVSS